MPSSNGPAPPCLPSELWLQIADYVDTASLLRLSEVSRGLKQVAGDELLWRDRFRTAFEGKQRIALPKSHLELHYLIDWTGQGGLFERVDCFQLAGILVERRRRGLVPISLLDDLDEAVSINNIDQLRKLVLSTHPVFLGPLKTPPFSSAWKLSYFTLKKDLHREYITTYELCSVDFSVHFRSPAAWLGLQPEPPRIRARHSADGSILFDGHPLHWRFIGDSDEVQGSPSRLFGGRGHHSKCTRRIQLEHYRAKHVSRTPDGGFALHNSQSVYLSTDLGYAEAQQAEYGAQEGQFGSFTNGPGALFVTEVAKVLVVHAAVVFGFGFAVSMLF